mgnify:FL=1
MVYDEIQYRADRDGDKHVEDRVLLDEHRRRADQQPQRQRDPLQVPPAERLRIKAGQRQRRAADDVHTGQHVRVGVSGINALHEPDEEIVLREFRRAQILSVREDQAEQDRAAEAKADIHHEPLERGHVVPHEVQRHGKQQRVPHTVGNDKIPAEWDLVVERQIGHPVVVGYNVLGNIKQNEIDDPDQKIPVVAAIFNCPDLPLPVRTTVHGLTPSYFP